MSDEDSYPDPTAPPRWSDSGPAKSPASEGSADAGESSAIRDPAPYLQPATASTPPDPPAQPQAPAATPTAAGNYLPPASPRPKRPAPARRHSGAVLGILVFLALAGWLIASVGHRSPSNDLADGGAKAERIDCPTGRRIDCRASDPRPQIGPGEFTHNPMVQGSTFALIRHDLGGCAAGARGTVLAAGRESGCTQVARSLYRSKVMAMTTLVFNLDTRAKAERFTVAVLRHQPLLRPIGWPLVKFPDLRRPHSTVALTSGHFTMVLIAQYRDFHAIKANDPVYKRVLTDAGHSLVDYIVARNFT